MSKHDLRKGHRWETRRNLSLPGHTKCLPGVVIAGTGYGGNKEGVDASQLFFSNFPTAEKMDQDLSWGGNGCTRINIQKDRGG